MFEDKTKLYHCSNSLNLPLTYSLSRCGNMMSNLTYKLPFLDGLPFSKTGIPSFLTSFKVLELRISSILTLKFLLSSVWISSDLQSIVSASDICVLYIRSLPFLVYFSWGICLILNIRLETVRWMLSWPYFSNFSTVFSPNPGFISITLGYCFICVVLPSKFRTFRW